MRLDGDAPPHAASSHRENIVAAWLFAYVGGTADYTQQNYLEVTVVSLLTAGLCVAVMVAPLLWQRRRAD
ncbi:hypothetical protein [Kytococcus sedentarius]|uniref:hypothetical protein n=1 Tax=Kytococcus sedentarius TaxID=1276 RepID=UPI00194DC63A|nr:hypothetical protein [Kytococcus sedentarius]QRO87610.1 hypothetical protein I6J30_01085 [Kytococcus sedentarius]